ncbi:VOC family protein [Desertivirga arenae]|uniref:VOC family protein n=1 Tax=Desertivirga arenae TaxID=2810309 RepID=UPI001A95BB56|nr:VOC family protein [Pedobacter sp. SYSU D00823]
MIKELWLNLPVKDVQKAREFYTSIGFEHNTRFQETPQMASLFVGGKKTVLMLFSESVFQGFSQLPVADTREAASVLFSIDAESPQEIDELAEKVKNAGGTIYGNPGESQGWMYGCGFTDLDGHRWSAIYMDMSKMPQG